MEDVEWERYRLVSQDQHARAWLTFQATRGLAANTIQAYGRALEDYLKFCLQSRIEPAGATRDHIALYLHQLMERPVPPNVGRRSNRSSETLSNATLQQRLTAVRLYYDYLFEEGVREYNPVGRGRYSPGNPRYGQRGILPRYERLPWIPTEDEWRAILEAARNESIRNRAMLAMAYDAGLRREELCSLGTGDVDPAHRLLHIRAEHTKTRRARVVPYSETTGVLYGMYLRQRREVSRERGPLFLSESHRNQGQPVTIWTWSKVIRRIALRAGVEQFTTHTLRHLCLTDLARAGWEIHEIALFAGHRDTQTTLLYIHLSGRELVARLQQGMSQLHQWRIDTLAEILK